MKDAQIFDNEQWFRAMLTTKDSQNKNVLNVFYVDYGIVRTVDASQVYSLQEVNYTLYRYPPQAMLVRLDNIPPLNNQLLDKIRKLLPSGKDALVISLLFN